MNACLQCLANTEYIKEYLLDNYKWHPQINYDNPRGYHGKLIESFYKLIKEMWVSSESIVIPIEFKSRIDNMKKFFKGNQQHDAQELLIFLLDGLQDEVNLDRKCVV